MITHQDTGKEVVLVNTGQYWTAHVGTYTYIAATRQILLGMIRQHHSVIDHDVREQKVREFVFEPNRYKIN